MNKHFFTDSLLKKVFANKDALDIPQHFLQEVCGINTLELQLDPIGDTRPEDDVLNTAVDLLAKAEDGLLDMFQLRLESEEDYLTERLHYFALGTYSQHHEDENGNFSFSKAAKLGTLYSIHILDFDYCDKEDDDDPISVYQFKDKEHKLVLTDGNGRELLQFILLRLPKITENSPEILQHWGSLIMTEKVSPEAPEHLQRAAKIVAAEMD